MIVYPCGTITFELINNPYPEREIHVVQYRSYGLDDNMGSSFKLRYRILLKCIFIPLPLDFCKLAVIRYELSNDLPSNENCLDLE